MSFACKRSTNATHSAGPRDAVRYTMPFPLLSRKGIPGIKKQGRGGHTIESIRQNLYDFCLDKDNYDIDERDRNMEMTVLRILSSLHFFHSTIPHRTSIRRNECL